jgi:hypothetical protein
VLPVLEVFTSTFSMLNVEVSTDADACEASSASVGNLVTGAALAAVNLLLIAINLEVYVSKSVS